MTGVRGAHLSNLGAQRDIHFYYALHYPLDLQAWRAVQSDDCGVSGVE